MDINDRIVHTPLSKYLIIDAGWRQYVIRYKRL